MPSSGLWILLFLLRKSLPVCCSCDDLIPKLWQDHVLQNASLLNQTLIHSLRDKCDIDKGNANGDSSLMLTVAGGYFDSFQLLLEAGAAVNMANRLGFTALHVACAKNRTEFALALIPYSVVSLRAANGMTAFLYACRLGNARLLGEFLRLDVPSKVRDREGYSCLHLAVISGSEAAVTLLLRNGFDINVVDNKHRRTPLMLAAGLGLETMVRVMLEHTPDLEMRDAAGRSALEYAYSERNQRVIDKLRWAIVQRAAPPPDL